MEILIELDGECMAFSEAEIENLFTAVLLDLRKLKLENRFLLATTGEEKNKTGPVTTQETVRKLEDIAKRAGLSHSLTPLLSRHSRDIFLQWVENKDGESFQGMDLIWKSPAPFLPEMSGQELTIASSAGSSCG